MLVEDPAVYAVAAATYAVLDDFGLIAESASAKTVEGDPLKAWLQTSLAVIGTVAAPFIGAAAFGTVGTVAVVLVFGAIWMSDAGASEMNVPPVLLMPGEWEVYDDGTLYAATLYNDGAMARLGPSTSANLMDWSKTKQKQWRSSLVIAR